MARMDALNLQHLVDEEDAQEQSLKHAAEEAADERRAWNAKRSKPGEEPGQEVKKTKVDTKAAPTCTNTAGRLTVGRATWKIALQLRFSGL